jgi:nitrogen fixation/metabolism regulation signal transduction histidine kinase
LKNAVEFMADIDNLRARMGKGPNALTHKEKIFINEQKLAELKSIYYQLNADIEREVDEFFGYWNMKKANIEILDLMLSLLITEISKLESNNNSLKPS